MGKLRGATHRGKAKHPKVAEQSLQIAARIDIHN